MWNPELIDVNRKYNRESIEAGAFKITILDITIQKITAAEQKGLDTFLNSLWSYFPTHMHLFPQGDLYKFEYATSLLSTWNNYLHLAQRQI